MLCVPGLPVGEGVLGFASFTVGEGVGLTLVADEFLLLADFAAGESALGFGDCLVLPGGEVGDAARLDGVEASEGGERGGVGTGVDCLLLLLARPADFSEDALLLLRRR